MSVLLSVCQLDQFVVKKFLSNIFFLHQLQTLIANWSVFVRISSAKLTTLPFTSPRYQFDERKTFWQIFVCFIYHLRTLSKKIKAFFGKQSAALSKWLTTCPRRFFAKNFFFKKVLFLFQHWALSERFLSFRRKFVGPVVSTAFCLSLRPVCGEKILSNFFFSISYGHVSQNYWSLLKFFSAKLTTLLSTSPKDQFEVKLLLWKVFVCFLSFSNIEREINGFFVGKQIAVLSKLLTTCQGDLLKIFLFWKSSFFAHHWNLIDFISGISTKNSLRCRQNCFLSVHCNILW